MSATAKPPRIDIRPDHWVIVCDILHKHVPRYDVWAFGSRAKWTAKEYSDLDLAVITDKPLSLSVSAALADDFAESDLPWRVDIVDWATTSESFRKIIERDKVVVQEAQRERLMVGEWRTVTLEESMAAVIDYRGKTPRKVSSGIPLITAKVVKGGRIEKPDEFIAEEDYADWMRRGLPQSGDVLVTTEAPLGEVAQLSGERVALAQRLICLRGKPALLDNNFLKFLMQSERVQEQLRSRASGTTVLGIKQSELRQVVLTLPPLEQQRTIAQILGTLDDKIDLNRRMNETLEATAWAIFKSWFVDFDPVRAKASGEPTESICRRLGLTPELLALFPDRLVNSDLGEIPEGWEVKPLARITSCLNRGISPKYIDTGGLLVLNQKCVRDGRVDGSKARRHDPAQRSVAGRLVEVGDVLVNSTGVGTLGRVAQVLAIDEPTIVDSHVTVARADPAQVSWNFLGVAMQAREAEIEALGEGSTGQTELSRVRLGALPLLVPPKPLRDHFDEAVLSLRLRTKRDDEQNLTLASIRDALLPKLLSGELRIPIEGAA